MTRITLDSGLTITYERFDAMILTIENISQSLYYEVKGVVRPGQFIPDEIKNSFYPEVGPNSIRTIEFLP